MSGVLSFLSPRIALSCQRFPKSFGIRGAHHKAKMGKASKARKTAIPPEEHLIPPTHPQLQGLTANAPSIIDTHSHISSTYEAYRKAYPNGAHNDVYSFTRAMVNDRNVSALVDVFCEAPVLPVWKNLANADEKWGDLKYRFVMGVCSLLSFLLTKPFN
jgi:hypothetical protein